MGDPAPVFKMVVPYDRGEDCIQTTIKVLPGCFENILVNVDKHHIFARLTMRNGEKYDGFWGYMVGKSEGQHLGPGGALVP